MHGFLGHAGGNKIGIQVVVCKVEAVVRVFRVLIRKMEVLMCVERPQSHNLVADL